MISSRISKFLKNPTEGFYLFLGLSIIICVIHDVIGGVWNIHTGLYYPWRHVNIVPLFPAPFLILEWCLLFVSSCLIISGNKRNIGVWLATFGMLVELTQHYSNHRSLIFIVLFYLCLQPVEKNQQSLKLIRYQLLIVYLFSAVNKITSHFFNGESLMNLGKMSYHAILPSKYIELIFSPTLAVPLSCAVVIIEMLIPLLLINFPRVGLALVIFLHVGFSLCMPGIWSFTLIMLAMAMLYLPQEKTEAV